MVLEQTPLGRGPECQYGAMKDMHVPVVTTAATCNDPPLLCRCGKLIWNEDDEINTGLDEKHINDQKSTSSISALSNPDSTIEGIQAKKRGKQCDDCLNQNDDCATSDGSSIWPPSIITLDQRDRPPRPAIKQSSLRRGDDSVNTEPSVIALSYSKCDSIATPKTGNANPKSAKSTYGFEDRSKKSRPEMMIPFMEGMSDDLLQILTDDSDKSGRMVLVAEVGIGSLSLEMTETLSTEESIHEVLAVHDKPWDEISAVVSELVPADAAKDESNHLEARESSPTAREENVVALALKVEDTISSAVEGREAAASDMRDLPEHSPAPFVAPLNERRMCSSSSTLASIERRMRLASMRLNAVNASTAKNEAAASTASSSYICSNRLPSPLHKKARSSSILLDEEDDHGDGDEDQENNAPPPKVDVKGLKVSGATKNTAATEDLSERAGEHEPPLSASSTKIIEDNDICSVVETESIEDDSHWNSVSFVCCRGQMQD